MVGTTDIIKLDSVTKIYKNFTAVNGVSLQINEGEILGLIGHNGAGKTTTLKMMVGLLAPTSGSIEVMGYDITKENTRVKQHIGYLPEESPLYENMTVRQYLEFFAELYKLPRETATARIESLLDSLKLEVSTPTLADLYPQIQINLCAYQSLDLRSRRGPNFAQHDPFFADDDAFL